MKKWWLIVIGVLIVGFVSYNSKFFKEEKPYLQVGETKVFVEVRDTDKERQQGLSGKESLGENEGMYFLFDRKDRYGFWMKEMKFDLDFVWIDEDRVVEITELVMAPKEGKIPETVKPSREIDKVLEVNSGWVKENGVEVGDEVRWVE